jgi:putative DNA primase/helicase
MNGNGNGHLPYSRPFQTRVLRFCVEDRAWLPYLKPAYFDNPLDGQTLKLLRAMPPPVSLRTLYEAAKQELGKPAASRVMRGLLKPRFTEADRAYLMDTLPKFVEFQQLGESFIDASKAYKAQDLDGLRQVRESLMKPLPGSEARFALTTLSDVTPRSVPWMWRNRLVRGAVTLFAGDPGTGKSLLAIDIGARVTRGERWPDGTGGKRQGRDIIVLATEDALEYTIRPRFEAAGADLTKVHSLSFQTKGLSLVEDAQALEALIVEKQAAYVVIDPLSDYLPDINTWRDNEVRVALKPFAAIAQRHGVAAIANMHLSKSGDRTAIYRILGSVAFTGLARTVFLITEDPEEQTRRLFLPVKNNLGPKADGMAFRPITAWIRGEPYRIKSQKLAWLTKENVSLSADEALQQQLGGSARASQRAETLLKEGTAEGPVLATTIEEHAKAEHISERTIATERKRLRMLARKVGKVFYVSPPCWTKDRMNAWTPKPKPDEKRAG